MSKFSNHPDFPLAELTPYPHNAKRHTTEQIAALVESIRRFGFTQPIIIDENGVVLAGHGRYAAAQSLGLTNVPVRQVTGLTEEAKKAYRLIDNKLTLDTDFDPDLYQQELDWLTSNDYDVAALGFIYEELGNDPVPDVDDMGEKKDVYDHATIKQIVLYLPDSDYRALLQKLHRIAEARQLANNTLVVEHVVNYYLDYVLDSPGADTNA